MNTSYQLLDSGNQLKLEKFGAYTLIRPCSQALWRPERSQGEWAAADATFSREKGNAWHFKRPLPASWHVVLEGVEFRVAPTDFGHIGIFPEHSAFWPEMQERIRSAKESPSILNLFAYSGGATLAAAQAGAHVCHLDASKPMVAWARENAALNRLEKAPIRWIVDDVFKFLKREIKRGVRYEGILLDPPSFGRGSQKEVFKIERDIHELLDLCFSLLSSQALFLFLTTHTPGMTPLCLEPLLKQKIKHGKVETGEMSVSSLTGWRLPSGSYAKWTSS